MLPRRAAAANLAGVIAFLVAPLPARRLRPAIVIPHVRHRAFSLLAAFLAAGGALATCYAPAAADSPEENAAVFYRAINLAGPASTIDGRTWEAGDAEGLSCADPAFESQDVPLDPPTDEARARMIRDSRWSREGRNDVSLTGVPPGAYSVYLYVWEDNDTQRYDVLLQGRLVAAGYESGAAGHWSRLGPWLCEAADGTIRLTSSGGHANFSGIEIWQGEVSASPPTDPRPQPLDAAGVYFDATIAPLFARHCLECHNVNDRKGGLDLSHRDAALTGGESGAVILPADADGSLLWQRIAADEMPPAGALADDEKRILREWLAAGAAWGSGAIDPFTFSSDARAGYDWWSLQPPAAADLPAVRDASWPAGEIDRFVLAELESHDLAPSPPADRRTLVRRLYFDLWGLPPTPEEVQAFVDDDSPRAYARLVDALLESPHYGERWARHWLDVVRYGESQGFERNKLRENAWKYRDWVVEAFNADVPYDEFVRLQIAGDVLRPDDPLAVVASGFLVAGPYDLTAYTDGTANMRAFAREEELEGLVAAVSQTFLGLTVNCARCHDHKFDPIAQRDYYRLAAALAGTYHGEERESLSEAGKALAPARQAALAEEIEALQAQAAAAGNDAGRRRIQAQISRCESVLRLLAGGPAHVSVPQNPGVMHVLARGDYRQRLEAVAAGGLQRLPGGAADWGLAVDAAEYDRRRALADWITAEGNPLLARTIVNRLWAHHFGLGLVATPNDLGFNGSRPSHPRLLDWLAVELSQPRASESGPAWSLKRLQRLMVMSAAYRQTSQLRPAAREVDADNRLLWRMSPRRLDAESLRDAILSVSGELDPAVGGPGYRDWTVSSAGNNETYSVFDAIGPEFNRRTLYRTWLRTGTSPLLDALDCPDPSVATPRRSVTTTPLQALSLLNNPWVEQQAGKFAARLEREAPGDVAAQAERASWLAFARPPSAEEASFAAEFIQRWGLAQHCLVLFNANEFLYVD